MYFLFVQVLIEKLCFLSNMLLLQCNGLRLSSVIDYPENGSAGAVDNFTLLLLCGGKCRFVLALCGWGPPRLSEMLKKAPFWQLCDENSSVACPSDRNFQIPLIIFQGCRSNADFDRVSFLIWSTETDVSLQQEQTWSDVRQTSIWGRILILKKGAALFLDHRVRTSHRGILGRKTFWVPFHFFKLILF